MRVSGGFTFCNHVREGKRVYEATGGGFDITVAPLVNAWGFGFKNEKLPSDGKIDSLLQYVGMDKVQLEGVRLVKLVEGVQIDASSIAKGLGWISWPSFFLIGRRQNT